MIRVKVNITDKQKKETIPQGSRLLMRRACNAVLKVEQFPENAEVNITLVDDAEIQALNRSYRNIDEATDVLSFPLGENGVYDTNPETGFKMLGDIVISVEHAVRQAKEFDHTIQREIAYLTVHSMLHLLGYDHVGGVQTMRMREKEEEVLAQLGTTREKGYEEV